MSYFLGKQVLVAGATGLIGSHLVEELARRGARVIGTQHKKPPQVEGEGIEYRSVDLNTRAGCEAAAAGCEVAIVAAADTSGAFMMKHNPVTHVTQNVILNSTLIESCWRAGVKRIQFVSTTTVYEDSDQPMREEQGFDGDPHPVYFGVGWMKRYVEKLLAFYQRTFNLEISLVRPTNVYGPRDKFDWERSHVLPALIRRAIELPPGQNLEVWGDGSATRDFVYVTDYVQGSLHALEHCADGRPINLGSGQPVTIGEAAHAILRLLGSEAQVAFDPSKPTTIHKRLVDLTLARERLGWDPKVEFEEGLRRTIAWYQAHPEPAQG